MARTAEQKPHDRDALRVLERENRMHAAVCDWIREDAPITVKMSLMPEHVAALVRRLALLAQAGAETGGRHVG